MAKNRFPRRLLALGALLGLAAALPAQGPFPFKEKLPPETILYAAFPDLSQSVQDFQASPFMKLFREPEVQEFLAQPLAMLEGFIEQGKAMLAAQLQQAGLPVTAEEVLALRPGGLFLGLIGPGGEGEPVRFAAAIQMAGNVAAVDKLVGFGLQMAQAQIAAGKDQGPPVRFLEAEGARFIVVDTTKVGGPFGSITTAYRGGTFLLASSEGLARAILGGGPTDKSLVQEPVFRKCFAKIRAQGAEAELFLRPAALLQAVQDALAMAPEPRVVSFLEEHGGKIQAALAASGLNGLQAVAAVGTYLPDGKTAWDSFTLAPTPRKGFLAIGEGQHLDQGHLAWVPREASQMSMGFLHLAPVVDTLLQVATAVDEGAGQMAAMYLDMLKQKIGVDLRAELLDLIGGEYLFYSQSASNITSLPPMAFLVQVKEQEKLLNSLETLLGLTQGAVTLSKHQDAATAMTYWKLEVDPSVLGAQAAAMPFNPFALFQPTFAFHHGFWVLTLSPRDLKKAVAQMEGAKGDIRDNPEMKAFLAEVPEKVSALSFWDTRETIRSVNEVLQGVANFISIPKEIPIDLALMPGTDTLIKHFFAQTAYAVTTDEGFLARTTSPLGPETVAAAVVGVGAAVAFIIPAVEKRGIPGIPGMTPRRPGRGAAAPGRVRVEKPQPPPAAQAGAATEAQLDLVRDHMDGIANGLIIYKVEFKTYPPDLETLVQPTENYPRGFLSNWAKTLPKDPWGCAYRYQRTEKGYRIWSHGPNGKDEMGQGDDILRER